MRATVSMLAALMLVMAGCVATDGEDVYRTRPRYYSPGEASGAGQRLIPFATISGYLMRTGTREGGFIRLVGGLEQERPVFEQPVAVGANATGVYMIDAATNALYRFRWQIDGGEHRDARHVAEQHAGLSHPEFKRLLRLDGIDEATDLYVSDAGDIYVADGGGRKVVRYNADGVPLQTFTSDEFLNRPVAVTVGMRGKRLLIADGLFDRIVVFNPNGTPLYGIGSRGDRPGSFKNIRDMVQGGDGVLYVVDAIHRRITAYGLDGSFLGVFGTEAFTEAGGIAVDDEKRVYLSDRFNHRILIFRDRRLIESYGRHGTGPGEFNQPTSLAYDDGRLYVTDLQNARIQVFRVAPESLATGRGKPQ